MFIDHVRYTLRFSQIMKQVEYVLTDDGKDLWDAILPLLRWTMNREGPQRQSCSGHCRKNPGTTDTIGRLWKTLLFRK